MEKENLRTINATLAFFMDGDKVLLGEKKRGFAKGTLNGIGGKQDAGETIEQAMRRECEEEIGARPTKYEPVAKIDFDTYYKGEHVNMSIFVYKCYEFSGKIVETEEILPFWFKTNEIPFDRMLQDDLLWIPYVLKGEKVVGKVVLDQNLNMLSHEFKIIEAKDEKLF